MKFWISGFLDFWIFGFLDFWIFLGFQAISRQRKELPKISWCQNDQIFEGFLDFFGFLAISRQQKEIPEIRWCQNDQIFEGFLDFPKNMKFWISGFLDFRIFFYFRLYLGNKKSYQKSAGGKTTRFLRAFGIFQKNMKFWISGFLDFQISGFFWISGYISATIRDTGNPLVSKQPDF